MFSANPFQFFGPYVNSGPVNILHVNVIVRLILGLAPIPFNFLPIRKLWPIIFFHFNIYIFIFAIGAAQEQHK